MCSNVCWSLSLAVHIQREGQNETSVQKGFSVNYVRLGYFAVKKGLSEQIGFCFGLYAKMLTLILVSDNGDRLSEGTTPGVCHLCSVFLILSFPLKSFLNYIGNKHFSHNFGHTN